MKDKWVLAAALAMAMGTAFAAGEADQGAGSSGAGTGAAGAQGEPGAASPGTEATPSVGGAVPKSEHQSEALRDVDSRFTQLDSDRDGKISRDEAQQDPALAKHWEDAQKGDATMDQAEFAQFESMRETGTNIYESQGTLPSTKHQSETVRDAPDEAKPDMEQPGMTDRPRE
jgi:hypothetical protein